MKRLFNIFTFLCLAVQAQPALQWQKTIGGSIQDGLYAICLGAGGQVLLGGASNSNISGEKTENSRGSADFWLAAYPISGSSNWITTETSCGKKP